MGNLLVREDVRQKTRTNNAPRASGRADPSPAFSLTIHLYNSRSPHALHASHSISPSSKPISKILSTYPFNPQRSISVCLAVFVFRDCHYIPRAAIYCFCYWDWILSKQVGGAGAVTIDCIFVLMVVGGWVGIMVVAVGGVGGLMQRCWLCIFDGKTGH